MSVDKHKIFLVTALCGIVIGSVIIGVTFYQYVQLLKDINAGKAAGISISQTITNAAKTNYYVIMISSVPLIILSVILLHRSLKELRKAKKKHTR